MLFRSGDGGLAQDAVLYGPTDIAFGPDGSMYICESLTNNIRRVSPGGIITRFAGRYSPYDEPDWPEIGDGNYAKSAYISYPMGVAVSQNNEVYIADTDNNKIRKLSKSLYRGNLIASEDGMEIYEFTPEGRHLKTLDALTGITLSEFSYDSRGYLEKIKDMDGLETTILRDTLFSVIDSLNPGAPEDSLGKHIAIVSPFGQRTILKSNQDRFASVLIQPNGDSLQFEYQQNGLMTGMIDAKHNLRHYFYDPFGKLILDQDPVGGFVSLELNEFKTGTEVVKTTAEGRQVRYRTESLPDKSLKTTNTFENGLQNITLNGSDGISSLVRPDSTIITSQSGPDPRFGLQVPIIKTQTIATPSGLSMDIQKSRTISEMTGLLVTGLIDSVMVNGRVSTSAYDGNQKLFINTSSTGRRTFSFIDDLGRVVKDSIPGLLPVHYAYDSSGFLVQTRRGNRVSEFSFDNFGRLQTITDPIGRVDSMYYGGANRLNRQVFPDGNEISYDYDANGNIISIKPPGKPAHTFTYTPVDLTNSYSPPEVPDSAGATRYFYNLDRQIVRTLFPDSTMIDVVYDTAGCGCNSGSSPAKIVFDRGEISMQYDSATGNLKQITAPGGETLNYTYDGSLPLSVQSTGSVNGTVSVTYNNDFQVTSQSVNGANTINYDYDDDGLLTQAGQLNLSYNNLNGLFEGTTLGNVTTEYAYNEYGEMTGYTARYNDNTILQSNYQLDYLGRITDLHEISDGDSSSYHYEYDLVGQLKEVWRNDTIISVYAYDANGNILSHITQYDTVYGVYDNQDRLLSYGDIHYGYTANGSLCWKAEGMDTTWYSYDLLGNLIEVFLPNGDHIEYIIDGQNRRIGKKVNGKFLIGWLYQDQLNPFAEIDSNGVITSQFIYGDKWHVPSQMIKNGITYRIISDHLGNVREIINQNSGEIIQKIKYDEFGNIIKNSNPYFQPFTFVGGLYDKDTKLVRFGARDYDSNIRRWTSKEPMSFAESNNFYLYCNSDPINYVDPTGFLNIKETFINIIKNPRVKAVASLGASLLAEYAAKNMCPGKVRGVVNLAASALAFMSAYQSAKVATGAFVAAFTAATPTMGASLTAGAIGVGFLGLTMYDVYLTNKYLNNAIADFKYNNVPNGKDCHDPCP